jgi:acid phosphatase
VKRVAVLSPLFYVALMAALTPLACGQAAAGDHPAPSSAPRGASSASPAGLPSPSPTTGGASAAAYTYLVILENRSYDSALTASFTASLAAQHTLATNYHAVAHPSLPNYLALTSGSTWGVTDDGFHPLAAGKDIGSQLSQAGLPWRAYMEGMTQGCFDSPYPYALKHNPFAYYGARCPEQVQPLDRLEADLESDRPPRFSFIVPDMCHDGHDCSKTEADRFLQSLYMRITASAPWRNGGLLLIAWDEDDESAGNHVAMLAITPKPRPQRLDIPLDHYSLLALIQDRLGVARLGEAIRARAIPDPTITT